MAENRTRIIRRRYDRIAGVYDLLNPFIRPGWRRDVVGKARGRVLEVGVGTGKNLPYYNPDHVRELVAIDFSPAMLARARRRAEECPVPVELVEMDAQHLQFPDGSFDSVVATCVFCSVPDPMRGLREIRRVLKPGGAALFLEHVRIDTPRAVGAVMDLLNPLGVGLLGFNINRRTVDNIRRAGFDAVEVRDVLGPMVKAVAARVC